MEYVIAFGGTKLPIGSLAQTFTYSGSLVQTISVLYPNNLGIPTTFVQTFTYSGTNVVDISQWTPT